MRSERSFLIRTSGVSVIAHTFFALIVFSLALQIPDAPTELLWFRIGAAVGAFGFGHFLSMLFSWVLDTAIFVMTFGSTTEAQAALQRAQIEHNRYFAYVKKTSLPIPFYVLSIFGVLILAAIVGPGSTWVLVSAVAVIVANIMHTDWQWRRYARSLGEKP